MKCHKASALTVKLGYEMSVIVKAVPQRKTITNGALVEPLARAAVPLGVPSCRSIDDSDLQLRICSGRRVNRRPYRHTLMLHSPLVGNSQPRSTLLTSYPEVIGLRVGQMLKAHA